MTASLVGVAAPRPVSVRKVADRWLVFDWGRAMAVRVHAGFGVYVPMRTPMRVVCCWPAGQALAEALQRLYLGERPPQWARGTGPPPGCHCQELTEQQGVK